MPDIDHEYYPEGTQIGAMTAEPVGLLDYLAPAGGIRRGQLVHAPLGPRKVIAVVWGAGKSDLPREKLRQVRLLEDAPLLSGTLLDFLEKAGGYTMTPLSLMLRMVLRVPDLGKPPAERKLVTLGRGEPARMTDARRQVLAVVQQAGDKLLGLSEIAGEAGVSSSVVKGLITAGSLVEISAPKDAPFARLDPDRAGKDLSEEQQAAAEQLRQTVAAGGYRTTLLHGVTGSGKTEVYLEAVAACLAQGKQALVLLPEISLSAEFLARVQARFGAPPGEWHSAVTRAERRRVWHACANGEVGLVAGARSALFLPFRDLGLIIVDEEHESAYKQEDVVYYHARDMAVLRAALTQSQVILASATPSLESWVNARTGKYDLVSLTARHGKAELPEMSTIDLRKHAPERGRWISPPLEAAIRKRLALEEQSLLFLNRRGYAPVTICRACGDQVACRHCDARMVEHRVLDRIVCHQCGATAPVPTSCPTCQVEGKMTSVGPGVERVAEEVATTFPDARTVVLSSDLFGTTRALKAALAQISDGDADIIIGTQIVAKGHNFPKLTLVGVMDADLGLQGADLRAAEKSFQLMQQVAGRAGRSGDRLGEALLQTFQPEHPVIRAILGGESHDFWDAEAAARSQAGMPPFGRLAAIILSHPDYGVLLDFGRQLAISASPLQAVGAELWGPAPAPIARIRGRHRLRMLIRADRRVPLQDAIAKWLAPHRKPNNLRLAVDIDPQSFL